MFAARRLLFLVAVTTPPASKQPRRARTGRAPSVTVIVAAYNEANRLERSLESLSAAVSPSQRVLLVSDGSTDDSYSIMQRWAAPRPLWNAIETPSNVGKGAALNAAIEQSADSEVIAVCDADVRVAPDCLQKLLSMLSDQKVGAVSAVLWPSNSDVSTVTRYCALELWQHQLIASAAKDRLRLNPPAHGWLSCYRREALAQIGGFPTESLGEDVVATNKLLAAGWSTRFAAGARVFGEVPRTLDEYWHQHVRWSRSLHDGAAITLGARNLSIAQRGESRLHAAGYLDRALLMAAAALAIAGRGPYWVPAGYSALLLGEALTTLRIAVGLAKAPRYLAAAVAMFPVDIAASLTGSVKQLMRRERHWGGQARRR
jgi:cellulose synthase/poly-beta-1,6-N-acetylglucosamine synthase-like glycosyltransferase